MTNFLIVLGYLYFWVVGLQKRPNDGLIYEKKNCHIQLKEVLSDTLPLISHDHRHRLKSI